MEKDCRKKKLQMKERSPLQNLNGLPFHKRISKNSSNLSFSSANAVSVDHPKNCSKFSLSSNSRFNLDKRSKGFSNSAKSEPNKSKVLSRSKENEASRNPISQKCEMGRSQCLTRRENGKNYRNPISINERSSKLSSVQGNPPSRLKKGLQDFQAKPNNSRQNGAGKRSIELIGVSNSSNLSFSDNRTPVGRVDSLKLGNHVIGDSVYEEGDNGNCGSDSKTPPVEASLSPEINCNPHSKMLVLKSEATPVCYGAGHLISGVSDRRKCRRRGSLRGGSEKVNLFDNDENLSSDPIPLLAEGSIRWHLSPSKEGCEDLEIDNNHDDSVGNVANKRRNRNVVISPNVVESLLVNSPSVSYSGSLSSGNNSKLSIGSLSSGNVIQTPETDSDVCVGRSRLDIHQSSFVWPELDSTTESLERVKLLSCRNGMSKWDGSDLGFHLGDKNVDSVSSWVSDSTLGNLSLSQMRISWRDGTLRSTSVENDEVDCCCVLSDDDIGGKGIEEKGSKMGDDISPELLDYEPCISSKGKERDRTAESICTDGGGLVASDDSDWTCIHQDGFK